MATNPNFRHEPSAPNVALLSSEPPPSYGSLFGRNVGLGNRNLPVSQNIPEETSHGHQTARREAHQEYGTRGRIVFPIIPQERSQRQQTAEWDGNHRFGNRNRPFSQNIPEESLQRHQTAGRDMQGFGNINRQVFPIISRENSETQQVTGNRNLQIPLIFPQESLQEQQTAESQAQQGERDLFGQASGSLNELFENNEISNGRSSLLARGVTNDNLLQDLPSLPSCKLLACFSGFVSFIIISSCIAAMVIAAKHVSCYDNGFDIAYIVFLFLFAICNIPYWPLMLAPGLFKENRESVRLFVSIVLFLMVSFGMFALNFMYTPIILSGNGVKECKEVYRYFLCWVWVMLFIAFINLCYLYVRYPSDS